MGGKRFARLCLGAALGLSLSATACLAGGCAEEKPVEGDAPTYVAANTTTEKLPVSDKPANNANAGSNTAKKTVNLDNYDASVDTEYVNNVSMTRADVASDAEYCNFRQVTAGKIKSGRLYRSASPLLSPRGSYGDSAMRSAGIKNVINLANETDAEVRELFAQEGFNSPYYKSLYDSGHVGLYFVSGDAMFGEDAAKTYAKALTWMASGNGPYLVHCAIGRDRTGFIITMVESLCDASWEEMKDDFMKSFWNLSLVSEESYPDMYWKVVDTWFIDRMKALTGRIGGDPENAADIKAGTIDYLKAGGMTQSDIDRLVAYLTS